MAEKVSKHNFPKGVNCHDCDKLIRTRSLFYRRLVDYSPRGVPITEIICGECFASAPGAQKPQLVVAE